MPGGKRIAISIAAALSPIALAFPIIIGVEIGGKDGALIAADVMLMIALGVGVYWALGDK